MTTVIDNIYVRITWTEPELNGAPIEEYKIYILKGNGINYGFSDSCDGQDPSQLYCLVPMTELTDPGLFDLPYGRLVAARVQALNRAGWSALSDFNFDGA